MKNNNFDEKIREKLDELKPNFEEKDWEKMASILRGSPAPRWYSGKVALWSAAAVVVGTMAIILLKTVFIAPTETNQNTVSTNANKIVIDSKTSKIAENSTEKNIENSTQVSTQTNITSTIQPAQTSESPAPITNNSAQNSEQPSKRTVIKEKTVTNGSSSTQSTRFDAQSRQERILSSQSKSESIFGQKEKTVAPTSENAVTAIAKNTEKRNFPTEKENLSNLSQSDKSLAQIALAENDASAAKGKALINALPLPSLRGMKPSLPSEMPPAAPKITVKPTQPRQKLLLGVALAAQKGHFSKGVSVAYALTPNIRVISGADVEWHKKANFRRPEDFKQKFDKDFKEILPFKPLDSLEFSNIDVHKRRIMIPLSIQGVFPLKNALSAVVGVGTSFNLNTENKVKFDTELKAPKPKPGLPQKLPRSQVPLAQNASLVNNLEFSLGLEAQWRRFNFQLTPFVTHSFEQSAFNKRDKPQEWGLRTRVFYILK